VAKVLHVRIDQEADRTTAHSQVGQQLSFVHGCRPGNCLEFNDHQVFDDDIYSITCIDREAFVRDRQEHFHFMGNAPQSKFVAKAKPIRTLE
jgi:hypothetical protein